MNRSSMTNVLALVAGWLAVAYFWKDGISLGMVPAWGAHIFVPAFILGAMTGITLVTVETWASERRQEHKAVA